MKVILVCGMALVFLMSLGASASAQQMDRQATTSQQSTATGQGPHISEGMLVTKTATVEAVDPAKRMMTLKGPEGKTVEVKVGPEVKNFSQIKAGDRVTARYYESVAVDVRKPGEAPEPGVSERRAMGSARPGQKPAGFVADQITITATVESIAPNKSSVTLKGPEGKSKEVKVRDPKDLQNVKAGDQVKVTYTEAMAVSVDKTRA